MGRGVSKLGKVEGDANIVGVIAYLTPLGFLIAIFLNWHSRTYLGAYHLRQMMGLLLFTVLLSFVPYVQWVAWLILFVLSVFGVSNAARKQMKPVPILGQYFENWFKGSFS